MRKYVKYVRYLPVIACLVILVVVGPSNALAGSGHRTSSQSIQNQSQPFHAELTLGNVTFTPRSNPCVIDGIGSAKGFMSIGSDSTDVSDEGVEEILRRVNCNLVTPPQDAELTGFHFFTTSNGDQLVAHVHSTGVNQPDGTTVFSGTFTFSGGTGQFARAQGSGTVTLTFPQRTAVFDGQISF